LVSEIRSFKNLDRPEGCRDIVNYSPDKLRRTDSF